MGSICAAEDAMAHASHLASLALTSALLLALPTEAPGQAGKSPKSVAMCLPPGAAAPVPCGTARAGQTIRLRIATTSLPTNPISLQFTEEAAAGQAGRRASLVIPPTRSVDGGYEVMVPRALCAGSRDKMGSYEIQRLMSTYNQAETTSESLGTLTVAC
jgi:hypothetical protein